MSLVSLHTTDVHAAPSFGHDATFVSVPLARHSLRLAPALLLLALSLSTATGCRLPAKQADLGLLYDRAAQASDLLRNPVIVIPGVLGSHLYDDKSQTLVWGAFSGRFANPETPDGARLVALPMRRGAPLHGLRDGIRPDGVLASMKINLAGLPLSFSAYRNILRTLGVGGFRDEQFGLAGSVHYGNEHFTCFQFDYDWRRNNVENARRLHEFILDKKAYIQDELKKRYDIENADFKFDLVAHSMGGLIARYYIRYGPAALPVNGDTPEVTWAGAENVERVVVVGTPSAGSVKALRQLVNGSELGPIIPKYEPAILGTMPSLYQLLPRGRHRNVTFENGEVIDNLLDPTLWERMQWGLASPQQADTLRRLMPTVRDDQERRTIALEHQAKVLRYTRQFFAAMDQPAPMPNGLDLHLVAGDSEKTASEITVRRDGSITTTGFAPGDATVTRASALLDERTKDDWTPRLKSPIHWSSVRFYFANHLDLTREPTFTDNLLYLLLEDPRR